MTALWRWLVLPVILIVGLGFCAVAAAAAFELSWQAIVWVTIIAGILSLVAILVCAQLYRRDRARQILSLFGGAIPRNAAGSPLFTTPEDTGTIEQNLRDLALLFGRKLNEAAQDQGQLRTIISSMTEGLIAVDRQQRILIANRAAETLLGVSLAKAKGQPLWEQVTVEGVARTASEVMLTGQPKTVGAGPVDGKYMEVMVSRLPAGAGLVIVAHDITEATRYQRLREEFVANVSHELRTPLSVIKGFIETLRDGAIDDRDRAIRYLDTVANHTEQLSNLVNDVLDLSRLDNREVLANTDRVDVGAILHRVIELMRPAAQGKQQKLEVEIAENLPPIVGSCEYLARAVGNLIENAVKYTPGHGEIRVSACAKDGAVLIAVEDNGIGISQEDLPRIFERFYRADQSRSRDMGGTGLGLSIVKHIVQGHGGTIEVTSKPGVGSKFVVKFPS